MKKCGTKCVTCACGREDVECIYKESKLNGKKKLVKKFIEAKVSTVKPEKKNGKKAQQDKKKKRKKNK